ncbi:hypothetical protein NKDENANG_01925 [Candidatus Entotheonellaceae bacterium PAL068K]
MGTLMGMTDRHSKRDFAASPPTPRGQQMGLPVAAASYKTQKYEKQKLCHPSVLFCLLSF